MVIAKKSFGQHFLRDASVIDAIVRAAEPEKFTHVVEVGPGKGVLTRSIAAAAKKDEEKKWLTLIEADRELIPDLENEFPFANILCADAAKINYTSSLSVPPRSHLGAILGVGNPWLFIGNLPYNAANAIVMNALTSLCAPERMVIMVQKEVGERMLGVTPSSRGVLTVAVQMYATVERVCTVKPGAFVPPPKVDSVVLVLTKKASKVHDREKVIALAKIGFSSRRKQLHRNLADAGIAPSATVKKYLADMGLSASARAEELSIEQWVAFAAGVSGDASGDPSGAQ